jgi:hypothetical protein
MFMETKIWFVLAPELMFIAKIIRPMLPNASKFLALAKKRILTITIVGVTRQFKQFIVYL